MIVYKNREHSISFSLFFLLLEELWNHTVAHTSAMGYVGNGVGAVTFWYGTYHDCASATTVGTQGSFTIQGVNGNTFPSTTVSFSTLTCTEPTGLVPGTNYFSADMTGPMFPYTPTTSSGPALAWQGAAFTGLGPGDYQFSYIPSASPTDEWNPYAAFSTASTITLTMAGLGLTDSPTSKPTSKPVSKPTLQPFLRKSKKSKADPKGKKADPKGKKADPKGKKGKR